MKVPAAGVRPTLPLIVEVGTSFGVSTIPATYLIDPQGTIIRLDLRGKALDEALARLIKRPTATTGAR